MTWLVFATAFVVRPVGAVLFGHLGDRIGRKSTFLITLIVMGLATFFMGLIPTYAQAGIVAPLLLTLLRIVQGIALGG
ncbi:MAG: MFS transporter, partial [Pyrobaculum sp.]|uniref:MFS transporter n=1 Tax=Pyrobaculum sp. TaxID=2004705 RepID=UPI003EE9D4B0